MNGNGLQLQVEKMGKRACGRLLGEHGMVIMVDPDGGASVWCRKCSGYALCRLGPNLMNTSAARKEGHERARDNFENNPQAGKRKSSGQKC